MYNCSATLSWNPVTLNADGTPLTDLADYRVFVGPVSRQYDRIVTTTGLSQVVAGLDNGATYFFAVTARDTSMNESTFSAEGSKLVTVPLLQLLRTVK